MKTGIDYMPLDIDFFDDEKIQFVSAKFGIKGEYIAVRLLTRIYRNSYYIAWNEDMTLLFAKRIGVESQLVNDVIDELIVRKFFDKNIFESYGVLTSNGIQKRYFDIIKRRKIITVINEYILNGVILPKNVDIVFENVDIAKTSKVSKVSKVSKQAKYSSAFLEFWEIYPSKKGKIIAYSSYKNCGMNNDVLIPAIKKQIKCDQWQRGIIPNPATWLNQGRWEDEPLIVETGIEQAFREYDEKKAREK